MGDMKLVATDDCAPDTGLDLSGRTHSAMPLMSRPLPAPVGRCVLAESGVGHGEETGRRETALFALLSASPY